MTHWPTPVPFPPIEQTQPDVEYNVWVLMGRIELKADMPAPKTEKQALSQADRLLKAGATRVVVERVERQILFDSAQEKSP